MNLCQLLSLPLQATPLYPALYERRLSFQLSGPTWPSASLLMHQRQRVMHELDLTTVYSCMLNGELGWPGPGTMFSRTASE